MIKLSIKINKFRLKDHIWMNSPASVYKENLVIGYLLLLGSRQHVNFLGEISFFMALSSNECMGPKTS